MELNSFAVSQKPDPIMILSISEGSAFHFSRKYTYNQIYYSLERYQVNYLANIFLPHEFEGF